MNELETNGNMLRYPRRMGSEQILMLVNICIYLKRVLLPFLQYKSTGFNSVYCLVDTWEWFTRGT